MTFETLMTLDDFTVEQKAALREAVNVKLERAAELVEVWGNKWSVNKIAHLIRNLKVDPS